MCLFKYQVEEEKSGMQWPVIAHFIITFALEIMVYLRQRNNTDEKWESDLEAQI